MFMSLGGLNHHQVQQDQCKGHYINSPQIDIQLTEVDVLNTMSFSMRTEVR